MVEGDLTLSVRGGNNEIAASGLICGGARQRAGFSGFRVSHEAEHFFSKKMADQ